MGNSFLTMAQALGNSARMVKSADKHGGDKAGDLWVFAYGSLLWRPGFEYVEKRPARLYGYHRAFCVYSIHHRGRPEHPGLVLGLDRGGACNGLAYRAPAARRAEVLAYLRGREQVTSVYLEKEAQVRFTGGGAAQAIIFVIDREHRQYAGRPALGDQVRLIREASGESGANIDYVRETVEALSRLGVRDRRMSELWRALTKAT